MKKYGCEKYETIEINVIRSLIPRCLSSLNINIKAFVLTRKKSFYERHKINVPMNIKPCNHTPISWYICSTAY